MIEERLFSESRTYIHVYLVCSALGAEPLVTVSKSELILYWALGTLVLGNILTGRISHSPGQLFPLFSVTKQWYWLICVNPHSMTGVEFPDSFLTGLQAKFSLTDYISVHFRFTEMFVLFLYLTISFVKYFIDHYKMCVGCVSGDKSPYVFLCVNSQVSCPEISLYSFLFQATSWPSLFPMHPSYFPVSMPLLFAFPIGPSLFPHCVQILWIVFLPKFQVTSSRKHSLCSPARSDDFNSDFIWHTLCLFENPFNILSTNV